MIDPQKELGSPSFTLPKESTPEAPSFVIETLSTTEVVEPQKEQEFPETPPRVDTPSVESDSSTLDVLRKTLRRSKKKKPTTIPQIRDEITVQVEKIMEDGLKDAFMEMTPVQ
ncbi:MAG: hypothetical protein GW939_02570, partial [Candidatus Magasanikbacteria bacterium]|nr:hypothetical protein [Candidatus Magasanikbacteria bacterium]